ncbi:IS200/IS605 family transposase [Sphaerochaeta halotolerans]|jgi:putative transposase|uniref:IS200/IS605 family transposase n=1 Tax=Sphaerochaeta halotolerans TaxID=2293840 RepID=A0A372MG05_9SPIR|nr:IS200/IS605 family transposase [Sphaerochaeta halotolerans]RFU94674.1 IS200/IS605 family transposase [Sphaerochaeta halotolerans]
MTKDRYTSFHAVYSLSYHIVFCPKYRRPVLAGIEDEVKTLLLEKARELETMPDHLHLSVSSTPAYAPQFVVNQLKGFTSRTLRQRRRWLRSRLPTLWARSYYIGSVGAVSSDTVSNFIANQKNV